MWGSRTTEHKVANLAAAALLALAVVSAAGAATRYRVTDLGVIPGNPGLPAVTATAITAAGAIAGYAQDVAGTSFSAFRYGAGGIQPGLIPAGYDGDYALGMNNDGHVVGVARQSTGAFQAYEDDGLNAGLLSPAGDVYGEARAVNGEGTIAGVTYTSGGIFHAVTWNYGVATSLHSAFGAATYSEVSGVNAGGIVAGDADDPNGAFHALRYDGVTVTSLASPAGYDATFARGLNDVGDVIGEATAADASRALLWPAGTTAATDLGTLSGYSWFSPAGINNSRTVVGCAGDAPYQTLHAFLYDGTLHDLNDLMDPSTGAGWTLNSALAVNDSGTIVGWGTLAGARHAFSLAPVGAPRTPVYALTPLWPLPGADPTLVVGEATGVNSAGQACGYVRDAAGTVFRAFRYDGTALTTVPVPGGFTDDYALAINEAGHVAGVLRASDGAFQAFEWNGAASSVLPNPSGDAVSEARGIGDNDRVAGVSYDSAGNVHAVAWAGGAATSLHSAFGATTQSEANGVSRLGPIAGDADDSNERFGALRYDGSGASPLTGITGYDDGTFARAANARGDAVGESTSYTGSRAVFWPAGSPIPQSIVAPAGWAYVSPSSVNNLGGVVGTLGDNAYSTLHAFLYDGVSLHDLNDLLDPASGNGWTLSSALGINDSGVIVGWGLVGGARRGFLLTPVRPANALAIAGGLIPASLADIAALNAVTGPPSNGRVDLLDAVRISRRAAGLDP